MRLVSRLTIAALTLAVAIGTAAAQTRREKDCESKNAAKAIPACTLIIKDRRASPDDKVWAYINRGDAYRSQRRNNEALSDYMAGQDLGLNEGALEASQLAAQSAGELAFDMKKYVQAMFMFQAALDDDESANAERNATLRYFLAISAANAEHFDIAMESFDEAIKLSPNRGEAYRERGLVHGLRRDFEKSLQDLDRAIELKPIDGKARYLRGITHRHMGNTAQARSDFLKAIDIDPTNKNALEALRQLGGAK